MLSRSIGIMLGENYTVENFGISARTLLNKGDQPYMQEKLFTEARAFHPDIVIIKLGTNDTKPHNWKYGKEFRKDLSALIDSFRCEGNPRIYLCYPATVYGTKWGINDSTIVHGVIPAIKKTARRKKVKIIDRVIRSGRHRFQNNLISSFFSFFKVPFFSKNFTENFPSILNTLTSFYILIV